MTEQFALEKVFGDCSAVDGEEGFFRAAAVLVDRAGDEFLAGPALAVYQHDDILVGDPSDRLVHLAHGRAAPDEAV